MLRCVQLSRCRGGGAERCSGTKITRALLSESHEPLCPGKICRGRSCALKTDHKQLTLENNEMGQNLDDTLDVTEFHLLCGTMLGGSADDCWWLVGS